MTMAQVGRHTNLLVGALIGAALIYMVYVLTGPRWGTGITAVLLIEAWTLVNRHPEDTISESVWRLSTYPLVPWLFGTANGAWLLHQYDLAAAQQLDPRAIFVVAGVEFLMGHFFWQARREAAKLACPECAGRI